MSAEVCPVCGADQTNKAWFVGKRLENEHYQAVCWECRERNVEIHRDVTGERDHIHVGPSRTAEITSLEDKET